MARPFRECGEVPFQPWAEALYKERKANNGRDDPEARCLLQGIPKMTYVAYSQKFLQTPGLMTGIRILPRCT